MKTNGNVESRVETKKEPLMRWMAMPNVVTKESPDTQQTGHDPRAAKMDGDAERRAGQVPTCSGWATV